MIKGIAHTHYLVVVLFLLIYVIKTVLLLSNKEDLLKKFSKMIKVPEMIISFAFLATGVFLLTQLPTIHYLMWIKLALVLISIPVAVIGFKKANKVLAALSLLMITAAFGISEVAAKKKMQGGEIAGNDGKAIYEAKCALCHGSDGKLGAMGAKDLSATAMDVAGIKNVVLNGQSMMKAVPMEEAQANAVAEYVNSEIKGH
jgi:mono/diheme cytochrome c family protein